MGHVQDKFRKCEADAVKIEDWKIEGDNIDSKVSWEFSMGWLNYANGLNGILKQIGVGTVLAPFERAICTANKSKIKHLHEQFWTVYLNHVAYSKILTNEEKTEKKVQILKMVTRYCPWFGSFWV